MDQQSDAAWPLIRAAADAAAELERAARVARFAVGADGTLFPIPDGGPAALEWHAGLRLAFAAAATDPRQSALDLYLPICSATTTRPIAVGHLGQSLDAFIATHSGDSQFVTGSANIVHLHRMRALCDAVIVGSGTVAADDPQLTTGMCPGPNPLRVVFDPARRVGREPKHRLFNDPEAPTLYFCARDLIDQGETRFGTATIVSIDVDDPRSDAALQ